MAVIVALDQVTKAGRPVRRWPARRSISVIPGFLDLTHVHNTGAAFGLLNAADFPVQAAGHDRDRGRWRSSASATYATHARRRISGWRGSGLALIIGGAAGNLIDRAAVRATSSTSWTCTGRLAFLGVQCGRRRHHRRRRPDDLLDHRLGAGASDDVSRSCLARPAHRSTRYGVLLAAAYLLGLQFAMSRARDAGPRPEPRARPRHLHHHQRAGRREAAAAHRRLRSVPAQSRGAAVARALGRRVLRRPDRSRWRSRFWYIRRHRHAVLDDVRRVRAGHRARTRRSGGLAASAAGCCYGRPTNVPWAITFTNPAAAANVGTPLGVPLHPDAAVRSGRRAR